MSLSHDVSTINAQLYSPAVVAELA